MCLSCFCVCLNNRQWQCQIKVKNGYHSLPKVKGKSSDYLFCPVNNLKLNNILFTEIQYIQKAAHLHIWDT